MVQLVPDVHVRRSGDDYAVALANLLPHGQAWPRSPQSTMMQALNGLAQIFGFCDARAADLLEQESDPRITIELLGDWERNWGLPDPCFFGEQTSLSLRHQILMLKMTLLGAQSRAFFIKVASWLGYTITITEYSPFMCGISRCGDTSAEELAAGGPPSPQATYATGTIAVTGVPDSILPSGSLLTAPNPVVAEGLVHFQTIEEITISADDPATYAAVIATDPGSQGNLPLAATVTIVDPPTGVDALATALDFSGGNDSDPVGMRWYIGPAEQRYTWVVHVSGARLVWFRCGAFGGQTGVDTHLEIGKAIDLECLLNRWKPCHTVLLFDYSGELPSDPMEGTP